MTGYPSYGVGRQGALKDEVGLVAWGHVVRETCEVLSSGEKDLEPVSQALGRH